MWTLSLFGTAVGAGILFLPLRAGTGGLWTLIILTILVAPMTYLSHRGLSRMVCAAPKPDADITNVIREFFGETASKVVGVLYFLSIYPIVLIYGVGITNTVDSLMVNQLGMASPPRWLLSGVLIALLMIVMISSRDVMLRVTEWVVYPLAILLLGVTLYLIPSWSLDGLTAVQPPADMLRTIWLTIPVLVFAFSHAAAISQYSVATKEYYGEFASAKASQVLLVVNGSLVFFTMSFVFSSVLALGPDGMRAADAANLPVLSYIANVQDNVLISFVGPLIAIAAISSSFFGHYLGAAEGAAGLVRNFIDPAGTRFSQMQMKRGIELFIFLTTWAVAIANPSILSLIERISGPVIAAILYLLPMYAIHKIDALAPFRGRISNVFVTVAGLVAISGLVVGFF